MDVESPSSMDVDQDSEPQDPMEIDAEGDEADSFFGNGIITTRGRGAGVHRQGQTLAMMQQNAEDAVRHAAHIQQQAEAKAKAAAAEAKAKAEAAIVASFGGAADPAAQANYRMLQDLREELADQEDDDWHLFGGIVTDALYFSQ
ncbi:unnamed protein product, partial [Amoebophrya sp. A25]|eukprot:GSA25T00022148001.1